MKPTYTWDEAKRTLNLRKHGLDFAHAAEVLESRFRMDVTVMRQGEIRVQSVSYTLKFLAVLTVAHTKRDGSTRIISFRRANQTEREDYYDWLENQCDEP